MDMRLFIASMAALQLEDSFILVHKYQWFCLRGLPPTPLRYKVMLSLGSISKTHRTVNPGTPLRHGDELGFN